MSRNTAIAIIIFVIAALAIIGAYYLSKRQTAIVPEPSPTSTPTEGFPTIQTSPPATQPDSGSDTLDTDNVTLILIEPYDQTKISSPVKISGFANVTESPITLNIKDANGKILGTGSPESCQDQNGCFFETEVKFQQSETAAGTIVATTSSDDQKEKSLQTVAVNF
jgi:hypothetical protein